MAVMPWLYNQASKGFRNEPARKLKDILRPVKHAILGKNGIYKAIEVVGELEKKKGREVKVVFDVGAAIGEATIPLLKAFPSAEVYCFEPFPVSFAGLKERTRCFAGRTHYFNCGLYNRNGRSKFYVWENHHDGSSVIRPPEAQKSREISITTRKLDDIVKELGIKHIDFIKIDVEGAEKEVLDGARATLRYADNVFVEISPSRKGYNRDYIDVFEYLHAAGLPLVGVYGDYFFTRLVT